MFIQTGVTHSSSMEFTPMQAEIVLKSEEKERLLQIAPENSPARAVLTNARSDNNQPELVIMNCDEQAAYALLEVAAPNCGSAWRVMNYQMSRLGLLKSRRTA
jgi:hypothetical protein